MQTQENLLSTAQATLLAPYDLRPPVIDSVFDAILAHKVDYADLYFQYSRSEGWSLEEGIVKSGSFNIDQGVGVRAVAGDKTAFAYSDDISMEALESAGEHLGLPRDTARLLTLQTAFGAAKMALESSEELTELRHRVTSPGGTTERAIQVLQKQHVEAVFDDALRAAYQRSVELAQIFGGK